jgi:hypothetical protein
VPFGFLRRRKREPSADARPAASGAAPAGDAPETAPPFRGPGIDFEGLTEEWWIAGRMAVSGRLSDTLNRRDAIPVADVRWGPIDGSAPLEPAPGIRSIDPYDLILVTAGEDSQPPLSEAEQAAHKVHKITYDVALEAPPFRVIGTVYLYPGSDPDRLLDRSTEMFVAATDAVAYLGETRVGPAEPDLILVNRHYLRGVEQVDKRTGERHPKLPGAPLGGVSWQDRSR